MRVALVLKQTRFDVLSDRAPDALEHLRGSDAGAHDDLVEAADVHRQSAELVQESLERLGATVDVCRRDAFEGPAPGTDLVVVVGGDGTVLDVSHRVVGVPLLGINSDPGRSVGYFCASDAPGAAAELARFADGSSDSFVLHRLQLVVDGEVYPLPCMNDLLVTNGNPGMMSRYVLTAGRRSETHSSSGVWVSTPAGSTAGIRSAGGTVMPLEGALLQYLVREPYVGRASRYELLRGVRHLREGLEVRSLMADGRIYVDGPYLSVPFGLGVTVAVREGPTLRILGLDPDLRER